MNLTIEEVRTIRKNILPGAIMMLIVSLFGFFGNFTILVSTIHSKKLKSHCNWLIAMLAGANFITQLAHGPYLFFTFTGAILQPLDFFFFLMLPSLISMNFGTCLILMIGIDRLLSIKYPARYLTWKKLPYTLLMTSPGVVYCIIFIILGIKATTNELVFCIIPEAYGPLIKNVFVGSGVLINAMVVATYSYLIMYIKKRNDVNTTQQISAHDEGNRRLLKAIVIIMLFEFFGWFLNVCVVGTAIVAGANKITIFYMEVYAGVLMNVSIACDFYVYFYNSTEYRNAFKTVLCFWRKPTSENEWTTASITMIRNMRPRPATHGEL